MNELNSLDAEQASMYRWIRKVLSQSMLNELTGRPQGGTGSTLDIDRALREAHMKFEAADAVKAMSDRSKIRSGILPEALCVAILAYTEAVIEDSTFAEGLGGMTFGDSARAVTNAFTELCEQIARIR